MEPANSTRERSLRSWLPPSSLTELRQEVSELIDSFFGGAAPQFRGGVIPRVDVVENANSLDISCDVPGWKANEISVEVSDRNLLLSGTRSEDCSSQSDDCRIHRIERKFSNFTRSIPLPCAVDESKVDAELHEGVLSIRLPKKDDPHRRLVPVRATESHANGASPSTATPPKQ